jgi:hypothetical protein
MAISENDLKAAQEFKSICFGAREKTGISLPMAYRLFNDMMKEVEEEERKLLERKKKEEEERKLREFDLKQEEEREGHVKLVNSLRKQIRDAQLVLDTFDDNERERFKARGMVYRIQVRKRKAKCADEAAIQHAAKFPTKSMK